MIKSAETERYCIASILRYPKIISDINGFIQESDFLPGINRTVFGAMLDSHNKQEDLNTFALAARINNAGITFSELDGQVVDYLEELRTIQISEKASIDFFKNLKKLSVRREIYEMAGNLQKEMKDANDLDIDGIINLADKVYGSKISTFESSVGADFSNIYENLEEIVEDLGNNPPEEVGLMGPFSRVNDIYGSLLRPGNITLIGARQNVGKSSLGHYYLSDVSYNHKVPVLHLDAGEMSEFELQMRSACMFTGGKVPLYYIEHGKWRQNEEFTKIVRESWNKVKEIKKIGCYYKNIGGLTPDEIVSVIRRFYYSKIGRGNPFVIHYDYLKSFDSFGPNSPEWQQMGYFVQRLKTLITKDIPIPIWTSLQLNRTGIVGNKKPEDIDDTENTFSISDRIIQQVSHGFLLRTKTLEELDLAPGLGNCSMHNVKKRHLGKDYKAAYEPVRMPDGSMKKNYFHIKSESFCFEELGDLVSTKDKMGVIMPPDGKDEEDVDIP